MSSKETKARKTDRMRLTLRGALFVAALSYGMTADEANAWAREAEKRLT